MGSSSSKTSSSSYGCVGAHTLFNSACLGYTHNGSQNKKKVTGGRAPQEVQTKTDSDDIEIECSTDVEKSDELPCVSPRVQLDQWDQRSISDIDSRTDGRSVQVFSDRPRNSSSRFFSRFNLFPRNISFRLRRTTSLGSTRSFRVSSSSRRGLGDEEEVHSHTRQGRGCVDGSRVGMDAQTISPAHPVLRDRNSSRLEVNTDSHFPTTQSLMDAIEIGHSGWTGGREHNERNVRFSRTLSVGRLRDRVLRHSSLSDLALSPLQQERETRGTRQVSGRNIWDSDTDVSSSFISGYASPSLPSSLVSTQDYRMETARSTESSYHELMERRSNFLERRRRIRSQVHTLRQLGSRFENRSGHMRSCILSGQHRTGRCTCHIRSHDTNINNDSSTRSSISRIVVLAETLFEVLDEIHQQSVVLSSQPSISSIGSVPAPNEVVESLPHKSYSKAQKYETEDTAQCYICLLDYEEGDNLRTLPCQHEFHRACVDKWLKEIHRVCPLCRGDVCRSNSLPLTM